MKTDTVSKSVPPVATEEMQEHIDSQSGNYAFRMSNPKLAALRAANPFLAILPFPNSTMTLTLGAVAVDVNIPSGTKLLYLSGSDEYYISRNGKAQLPAATGTDPDSTTGAFQNPEGIFIYCEEISQFSIIAVNAGTRVSIAFYIQL